MEMSCRQVRQGGISEKPHAVCSAKPLPQAAFHTPIRSDKTDDMRVGFDTLQKKAPDSCKWTATSLADR